jgi:hypothetical protein
MISCNKDNDDTVAPTTSSSETDDLITVTWYKADNVDGAIMQTSVPVDGIRQWTWDTIPSGQVTKEYVLRDFDNGSRDIFVAYTYDYSGSRTWVEDYIFMSAGNTYDIRSYE